MFATQTAYRKRRLNDLNPLHRKINPQHHALGHWRQRRASNPPAGCYSSKFSVIRTRYYIRTHPGKLHFPQNRTRINGRGMTMDELLKFVDQTLFPALGGLNLSTGNKRTVLVHEAFANNYNYMKSGIHLRQVINKLGEIDFNNSKSPQNSTILSNLAGYLSSNLRFLNH